MNSCIEPKFQEGHKKLLKYYTILSKLAPGMCGDDIYIAKDNNLGVDVCLKIRQSYGGTFCLTDAKRLYREVMILLAIGALTNYRGHENIVTLINVIKERDSIKYYLVFELMQSDLHKVIRTNVLQEEHKKFIIVQLLKAVKFLHELDIIHRDIKPSNILINEDCSIKLCDFELSRVLAENPMQDSIITTDYVGTRWYRPPEILIGSDSYTKEVDIWGIGCVLGELLLGKPLFPGKSTKNQLDLILRVVNRPKREKFFELCEILKMNKDIYIMLYDNINPERKSFRQLIPYASEDALDLLDQMLQFNPQLRISPEDALKHKWLEDFYINQDPLDIVVDVDSDKNKIKLSCINEEVKNKLRTSMMKTRSTKDEYLNDLDFEIYERKYELKKMCNK